MTNFEVKAFTIDQRWGVSVVHGQACWRCNAPLDFAATAIGHVLPLACTSAGDLLARLMAEFGLQTEAELESPRNLLPVCADCGRVAPDADRVSLSERALRTALDRAARRAVMVRRAMMEAAFDPAIQAALIALQVNETAAPAKDDVRGLVGSWAAYQAKKVAFVRDGDDPFDYYRDLFARTTILYKPPAPLRLTEAVAVVFDPTLVPRLADLRYEIVTGSQ